VNDSRDFTENIQGINSLKTEFLLYIVELHLTLGLRSKEGA
jgi:hypothetical protein